jgi:hypothetical protein
MSVNLELLEELMKSTSGGPFLLSLDGKNFTLENVTIINSPTPVNSPTTRGGVYFSDKFAYKLKGTVNDLSIVPLLTKTMLGPNTEFGEIKVGTTVSSGNQKKDVTIYANLTNSVQGPSKIELNMIIVKLE